MVSAPLALVTDRLVVDRLRDADATAIAEMLCDRDHFRYFPTPFTPEDAPRWIARWREAYPEGLGLRAIRLRTTGELVGDAGAIRRSLGGRDELELGWHLLRRHTGHGYATEAAAALARWAFATLDPPRVIALIRPENGPSRAVAVRLGMVEAGLVTHADLPHLVFALPSPRRTNDAG